MAEYAPYSPPYLDEEQSRRLSEYVNMELLKISGEFFKVPPITISGMSTSTPATPGTTIGTTPTKITNFTEDYDLGLQAIHADHTIDTISLDIGAYQVVVEMVLTVEFVAASKTDYTFTLYANGSPTSVLFNIGTANGQDYASASITKAFEIAGSTDLTIYANANAASKAFEIQTIDTYLKVLKI